MYIFVDPQNLIGNRKCFTGFDQYKKYTKVISELIKNNKYDLDSYGRVEILGLHSV